MTRQWIAHPGRTAVKGPDIPTPLPPLVHPSIRTLDLDVTDWPADLARQVMDADQRGGGTHTVVLSARRAVGQADLTRLEALAGELGRPVHLHERER